MTDKPADEPVVPPAEEEVEIVTNSGGAGTSDPDKKDK